MKKTMRIYEKKNGCLVAEYRFIADRLSRADSIIADYEGYEANAEAREIVLPEIGKTYMILKHEYVGPSRVGNMLSSLVFADDNGEGFPGNSDRSIMRYHGWRGTTDDWAAHAMGVRKAVSAAVTGRRSRVVRIVFGSDIKKDED